MTENQHTEDKLLWRDEYLRWVCAFANADGGKLVIGKNDCGQVTGVADAACLPEDIPNKIRDILGIVAAVRAARAAVRPLHRHRMVAVGPELVQRAESQGFKEPCPAGRLHG